LTCFDVRTIHCSEEFAIYLNYVRKLGFEEAPDYDFLRELFAKVMKNNGDAEDGAFDWNLLNGTLRQSSSWVLADSLVLLHSRWSRMGSLSRCKCYAV